MRDTDQQQALSLLCHAAGFLSVSIVSLILPIAILAASENSTVRSNAKEAINFHLSLFVYAIAAFLLGCLGLLVFGLLFAEDAPVQPNLSSDVAAVVYGLTLLSMAGSVLLLLLIWLVSLILPIAAIVQIARHPGRSYRYPFILRFL